MKAATRPVPDFAGMRPLSGVLADNRVMRAARAASAADCVYTSTRGGVVTAHPVDRRTEKRVYFNDGRHVRREPLEREGCAYCTDGPVDEWIYVYASPGLAEALAGEALPNELPEWRDEEDVARDHRRAMRSWYAHLHEQVDRLGGMWGNYSTCLDVEYITADEAAVIHARIDHRVRADGYWEDDLPAQWWRK